jgi:hypothetical protein
MSAAGRRVLDTAFYARVLGVCSMPLTGGWSEEKTGRAFSDPAMAHAGYRRFTKPSRPWWKFW